MLPIFGVGAWVFFPSMNSRAVGVQGPIAFLKDSFVEFEDIFFVGTKFGSDCPFIDYFDV